MREGKLPERALELLAEMQGRGLDPNVITYSAAFYQRSYQRMREGTTT
jgi:pentatricopeptide repeat protein